MNIYATSDNGTGERPHTPNAGQGFVDRPVGSGPMIPSGPGTPPAFSGVALSYQAPTLQGATHLQNPPPSLGALPDQSDGQSDDLDREWVEKAKQVVETTKHDPYLEAKELGKIKAQYLKLRYNKQIKVAEDRGL